jgi:D-glycero-D-manno-heptose 1,7-bisphosphate phosphatase
LLLQAAKDLALDLPRSWMIGDAWTDLQAGQAAGVRQSILVRTGRGTEQSSQLPPDNIGSHLISDNLSQALAAIFTKDRLQGVRASP